MGRTGGRVSLKSCKTFRNDGSGEIVPATLSHRRARGRASGLCQFPAVPISQLSHTLGGAMRVLISFICAVAVILAASLLLASPIAHAQGVGASRSEER